MKNLFVGFSLGAVLSSCAVVKMHRVSEEWQNTPQGQVKRLLAVVQPLPENSNQVGTLFSLVTRRYVNQKRNFLVKDNKAQDAVVDLQSLCVSGLEGVLWLKPKLVRVGKGFESQVIGQLLRCGDGKELWRAEAAGSFPATDERLKEVTQQYETELGNEVSDYVAPAFNLLRPLLDTLPDPQLTEEDVTEKIELGE